MRKHSIEVILIRKTRYIFYTLLLLAAMLCLPTNVSAADRNSQAGIITTNQGNLYVRSAASTGSTILTSLPKGSRITLITRSGDWWKVEYASGRYGYCHASYITAGESTPAIVSTRSGGLNVRTGPGTSYAKVTTLPKNRVVLVLSTQNGWSRILYDGTRTGYVSNTYLSGLQQYGAIDLQVPGFKQIDSRWADVTIGTSGKTIRQIGCATTAVAMMESYRAGSLIYPDVMSRQLRYTPSGSVYWPEDYRVSTQSEGLPDILYGYLKAGKPVLLGAKNAAGKQHWVVVTGFAGGNSLRTADFYIEDPGSVNRVTLQQFLDIYPVLYKYFTYP